VSSASSRSTRPRRRSRAAVPCATASSTSDPPTRVRSEGQLGPHHAGPVRPEHGNERPGVRRQRPPLRLEHGGVGGREAVLRAVDLLVEDPGDVVVEAGRRRNQPRPAARRRPARTPRGAGCPAPGSRASAPGRIPGRAGAGRPGRTGRSSGAGRTRGSGGGRRKRRSRRSRGPGPGRPGRGRGAPVSRSPAAASAAARPRSRPVCSARTASRPSRSRPSRVSPSAASQTSALSTSPVASCGPTALSARGTAAGSGTALASRPSPDAEVLVGQRRVAILAAGAPGGAPGPVRWCGPPPCPTPRTTA
jgi:hypothetical protein